MRIRLSVVCAVLAIAVAAGACWGAKPKAKAAKPANPPAIVRTSAVVSQPPASTEAGQPASTMPSGLTPIESQPATSGAGPATQPATVQPVAAQPGAAIVQPTGFCPSGLCGTGGAMAMGSQASVTMDNDNVYVFQNGMMYKFAKGDLTNCGTPLASAAPPCPCSGMTFIPGYGSVCTVMTYTNPAPTGCGPCGITSSCNPCPTPCPQPCQTVVQCQPQCVAKCCPPKPGCVCATTQSTCAAPGAGPCSCPAIATTSACTQSVISCLQAACGPDVDKGYLQAMIQLNAAALGLSQTAADHVTGTNLNNWAVNSQVDASAKMAQARKWLRTKFCMAVVNCAAPPPCWDYCNLSQTDLNAAYRKQIIQNYVDEIALSQVEIASGVDCEIKYWASQVIQHDQSSIVAVTRCGRCL